MPSYSQGEKNAIDHPRVCTEMDQKIRIHVTCKKIKNKKNWGNLGGRREYTDAVKEQKA